jgi:hypothetical protein
MDWTHLTTVSDQLNAELLVQALHEENIEAVVNAGDTAAFLGVTPNPCRVMVVGDRWSEAIALLEEWEREEHPVGAEDIAEGDVT